MQVAYARTALPKSIFLAGPTPRDPETPSWRPKALEYLANTFSGTVFVPEDSHQSWAFSYDDQVEWELEALHAATVIVFWVPREVEHMPAFTTNVEFGLFAARRNVVLGSPPAAAKMKYLQAIATLYGLPIYGTLEATLHEAVRRTTRPFPTTV
jgi:hypothetical protein